MFGKTLRKLNVRVSLNSHNHWLFDNLFLSKYIKNIIKFRIVSNQGWCTVSLLLSLTMIMWSYVEFLLKSSLSWKEGLKANSWGVFFKHPPNLTCWRHILVDISSLERWDKRCQIRVHAWFYPHSFGWCLLDRKDVVSYLVFSVCISNCLIFLCRLKINYMMGLQLCAYIFDLGVVTNKKSGIAEVQILKVC
jgi:hypothetical protein